MHTRGTRTVKGREQIEI